MKPTLFCSVALLLAAGCIIVPEGLVYGNGHQTERTRGVSDFYTVTNTTNVPVQVHQGTSYEVVSTIDSNLQDVLVIERQGDELRIDVALGHSISPTGHPSVDVTMPGFEGASTTGSGGIAIDGINGARDIDLRTSGSGDLAFQGTAHRLTADTTGSGNIDLRGSAAVLVATVHGSGSIDARWLEAGSVDLTTTGSGSIQTQVMGGDIWCRITGSGDVDYWGSGVMRLMADTGSGNLYYRGLTPE